MDFNHILIIQTAFIGDVVLATPILSKLSRKFPKAKIDFLVRKGNESLIRDDDRLNDILVWDKSRGKNLELIRLIPKIRKRKYDLVVNVQRYASMGMLTFLSGAKVKIGFDKNPWSFGFDVKVPHEFNEHTHEVQRNLRLIASITESEFELPSLPISEAIEQSVLRFKSREYITIAPTSVWFTKQLPREKWLDLIGLMNGTKIYLIGGPGDEEACEDIRQNANNKNVENLCGKLTTLESVSLMKDAKMNYVNDSAPLHFASAANAPVTAFFCSTVPEFGFGPLSENYKIIQSHKDLACRPCGLHGFKSCPKGHFRCATEIDIHEAVLS